MIKDSRGQLSAEFVLIIGLMLVIVIVAANFIGPSVEENQVMSAARSGFINASNQMAYDETGNVLRLDNLTVSGGTVTAKYFSKKSLSSDEEFNIRVTMIDSISEVLNTPVTGRSGINPGQVETSRHTYTVTLVAV